MEGIVFKPKVRRNKIDKVVDLATLVYKDIEEAPGYKITEDGDVISCMYATPKYIKPYKNKNGKEVVDLRVDGKYKHCHIETLLNRYFPKPVPNGFYPIEGVEGYYVNNKGEILSYNPNNKSFKGSFIMKQTTDSNGYKVVTLNNKTYYVHRIVAETFIDNPENYPQVNNKDENKGNNNVDNLEWCTSLYNNNYNCKPLRTAEKFYKPYKATNVKTGEVLKFESLADCCHKLGASRTGLRYYIDNGTLYKGTYKIERDGTEC